jgi:plasmid stabilization system protein ParE
VRLHLRIFGRARRHIEEAVEWWRINRTLSPNAFEEDLREALELIRAQPGVGSHATNTQLSGIRRLHMSRVRYHLYYRLSVDGSTIEVIELWHSNRGAGPTL